MTPSRAENQATTLPHVPGQGSAAIPAELANHPRYRLGEVLGEGGMGTVFKAEHRLMKRWVALKVVRHALLEHAAVRERFLGELRAAARLTHPNIVVAHDAEEAGNLCFLAMEYVPGEDLATLVRRRGPLPAAEACDYVRQAALGLQHAHECGLVHRDIKPHNLILAADGHVKILDFGLARLALEQADADRPLAVPPPLPGAVKTVSQIGPHTVTGAVLGTPAYMAPEQAQDPRRADIRSDIYSLGRTLFNLLAGRLPAGPDGGMPAGTPPGLAAVLSRMLARDPKDRYQTPAEAAAALLPFAQGAATRVTPSRRRLVLGAASALLGVGGGSAALAVYLRRAPNPDSKAPQQETEAPNYADPRAETYVDLVARPNPTVEGSDCELTATVRLRGKDAGAPGGKVSFRLGGEVLGEVPLTDGKATRIVKATKGRRSLTAAYSGDESFQPSTSKEVLFRVGVNALHRIKIMAPKPGAFTLSFDGVTSPPIATSASPAAVQAAVNNFIAVRRLDGKVSVLAEQDGYLVTYIAGLSARSIPLMTAQGLGEVRVTVLEIRRGELP